uniref:Zgc:101716 n=1 Tax=Oryzias sinensis TaxID=183150 RepID=A0A8C7X6E8_9TELE
LFISFAQWFCESAALETDDAIEKQKVYKFRGDLAMRKGNYQKALEAYSSCLQWIADNNLTIRRDVLEGMARCCTKLGQRDRALDLVDLLVNSKEASNTCHLTSLLLLKVSIWKSKISCLQQLCSLLPFNPWHWLSLGQVCLQLLDPNPAIGKQSHHFSRCCFCVVPLGCSVIFHKDWIWLKACISFIRTRYSLWTHVLFKNGTRTCCLHLNHI